MIVAITRLRTGDLLTMADLLCRSRCPSGAQLCGVLGRPCGLPTSVLPSDGTGTTGCIELPDKAVSAGRHYFHNLKERHKITISD